MRLCPQFAILNSLFTILTPVGLFGQATKGAWWMPWGKGPMKDAASGETLR